MSYVIKAVKQAEETINVTVEFTLSDGKKEIIVPVFMPESKEAIIQSIENREISEQRRIDGIKMVASLAKEMQAEING